MPENGGFWAVIGGVAGLGVILGWILSLVGLGRKIEKSSGRIESSDKRLNDHDKKFIEVDNLKADVVLVKTAISSQNVDIAELRSAIKDILTIFKAADGEPRFITRTVCLGEQSKCHEIFAERFSSGAARFGSIEKSIEEVKDDQRNNLATLIEEIRKIQR